MTATKQPRCTGLAHIAVHTADQKKTLAFYCGLLGFKTTYQTKIRGNDYALVQLGGCIIEILQFRDKKIDPEQKDNPLEHFAVEVENIEGMVEKLTLAGYPSRTGVFAIPDLLGGVKGAFVNGPSGESIELFEHVAQQ